MPPPSDDCASRGSDSDCSSTESTAAVTPPATTASLSSRVVASFKSRPQDGTAAQRPRTRTLRGLLVAAGGLAAAAAGAATYLVVAREQRRAAEAQYDLAASDVIATAQERLRHVLEDLDAFGATVAALARRGNASWPFVTIPDFEELGGSVRASTRASRVALLPLVTDGARARWHAYSRRHVRDWWTGTTDGTVPTDVWGYDPDAISSSDDGCVAWDGPHPDEAAQVEPPDSGPYAPLWQVSPATTATTATLNHNLLRNLTAAVRRDNLRSPILLPVCPARSGAATTTSDAVAVTPVWDGAASGVVVGYLVARLDLGAALTAGPAQGTTGLRVVLGHSCSDAAAATTTYEVRGPQVEPIAAPDGYDARGDGMERSAPLLAGDGFNASDTSSQYQCLYSIRTYPIAASPAEYDANVPAILTVGIVLAFALTLFLFVVYDCIVQRRQQRAVHTLALKHEGLVSSLFPETVRKQVLSQTLGGDGHLGSGALEAPSDQSRAPIADLYLDCTVLFADIAGFTAWSSTREPSQVFVLLETVYSAFDELAKRRGVFKIETVGDCYVAVTGLPQPQKDHAVIMARFARDCVAKMQVLVHQLEVQLGPDTGDLAMRTGMHSGAVTGGVLRGDKARFQLFGDTMNTASRIETTGSPNRIHLSEETASLLIAAGKQHWVQPREERVQAKGKGELRTFWLTMNKESDTLSTSSSEKVEPNERIRPTTSHLPRVVDLDLKAIANRTKRERLVEWNCDVLVRLLKQVIARRYILLERDPLRKADADESMLIVPGQQVIDEVQEVIEVPNHHVGTLDYESIILPQAVVDELYDFVRNIADMYHDNPFHNFEHASHVAMSVTKLLSRIVAPSEADLGTKALHDHTYGITSDPLTQFACVFSALIHDVDHPGVPNAQLVHEKTTLAELYKGKSVAEQNSVDLAWGLLMEERYANLRQSIYTTKKGLERFRQMVVNSVMATDIFDMNLKELRNARWVKAFSQVEDESAEITRNRKATIVIEHLIQASDVAHTMQHWHIYCKWNERFFLECYKAYLDGRAEKDPSESWYKGEIDFFDFYIIPLAKKLKECGVFGKSSDEYLNYAEANRKEWEVKGEEVVANMVRKVNNEWTS